MLVIISVTFEYKYQSYEYRWLKFEATLTDADIIELELQYTLNSTGGLLDLM